jgi:hypothetical protein
MNNLKHVMLFFVVITTTNIACTKDDDGGIDQPATEKSVSGQASYSNGNPLPGAKITVEHTVWEANYVTATTDAGGNYNIVVPADPAGSWTAKAQVEKDAYGQHYICDLTVSDTSAFYTNELKVRNFTWNLTGEKIGGGFYGAHVDLYQAGADVEMTSVVLQLTPIDSQLLDGSTATTIEKNITDEAGIFMVKDIPIGKYKVKAIYPGKTLLLRNRYNDDEAAIEKEVVFGKNGFLAETEYNIEFWLSE